ncbi:hypothetical protein GCM10020229_24240 [Kitasatospora albolonga]|uniref:glycine-rich protein n=1 Tax=Kitasatospora albolonga TaxID=68173 RepID=UPI0031EE1F76
MHTKRRPGGARRFAATVTALSALAVAGPLGPGATAAHADPAGGSGTGCAVAGPVVTCGFDWTGGPQQWTVPSGVTSATVTAFGAAGGRGDGLDPAAGGPGGQAVVTLAGLTPGQVLQVNVGGSGAPARPGGPVGTPAAGGWNGGGRGYAGGGGASDVRVAGATGEYTLQDRLVVAGGGGGAGGASGGGAGGGTVGGSSLDPGQVTSGGTQTAGGSNAQGGASAEVFGRKVDCHDGGFGSGGGCLLQSDLLGGTFAQGGGGGGGWYGGGFGTGAGQGAVAGGAGSSHTGPRNGVAVTDPATATGGTFAAPEGANGNGRVRIAYALPGYSAGGHRAAAGTWTLAPGQSVSSGPGAGSQNGAYLLTMQNDGNLVVSSPDAPGVPWASSTSGNPGASARFTADGALQVVSATGAVLWRSAVTAGTGSTFVVNAGGALQILDRYGVSRWFASLTGEFAGLSLTPGDAVSVGAANHQLVMQTDGNLVWYDGAFRPLWASNTWGNAGKGYRFEFAPRGTLAIRDGAGTGVWSAGPASGGWWLRLQGDGNIVVADAARTPIWATGSSG